VDCVCIVFGITTFPQWWVRCWLMGIPVVYPDTAMYAEWKRLPDCVQSDVLTDTARAVCCFQIETT